MDVRAGDVIDGKYRLVKPLGEGGMAQVWEARHELLNLRLAVKLIRPKLGKDPGVVARFIQEVKAVASLGSRYIIKITDAGTLPGGEPFMVMEYLDGEELVNILKREGRLEPERVVALLSQVCQALTLAHQKGIIHRDLKPDNLYVVRNEHGVESVKVLDFGIAKILDSDIQCGLTRTGIALGTPFYMSPEQLQSAKDVDHRADIYSVGVILYEALTGRLPFTGSSLAELAANVLTEEVRPPRELQPRITEPLQRVVMKALARRVEDRQASMYELQSELCNPDSCAAVGAASIPRYAQGALESGVREPPVASFVGTYPHEQESTRPQPEDDLRAGRRQIYVAAGAALFIVFIVIIGISSVLLYLSLERRHRSPGAKPPVRQKAHNATKVPVRQKAHDATKVPVKQNTHNAVKAPALTPEQRFIGRWQGMGRQSDGTSWPMLLELTSTKSGPCGAVNYLSLGCQGIWHCVEGFDGKTLRATEQITVGRVCANGMVVEATVTPSGQLNWRGTAHGQVAFGLFSQVP